MEAAEVVCSVGCERLPVGKLEGGRVLKLVGMAREAFELQPTIFSNHVESGGPNNNMRTRTFFEMARNPILPFIADQVSISRTAAAAIDTNNDNQIGFMEKVKAWCKFRLW